MVFFPKTQEQVSKDQFPFEKLGWVGTEKPCQGVREPRLESLQTNHERKFWLQILHPCMKRLRCQLSLTRSVQLLYWTGNVLMSMSGCCETS